MIRKSSEAMKAIPISTRLILISAAALTLASCASGGQNGVSAESEERINNALARAATSAQGAGDSGQSVGLLEKLYNRNPKDEGLALRYASALRDAEYYNRALLVLSPFANDEKSGPAVKAEFASIHLAMGNYPQAEQYAQKAIVQDPANAQASGPGYRARCAKHVPGSRTRLPQGAG
jgi:Flp pilus assembly protein TadD